MLCDFPSRMGYFDIFYSNTMSVTSYGMIQVAGVHLVLRYADCFCGR